MINISNLKKSYGNRVVLDIPKYYLAADKIHVLAGHNGSGKSTLMRIISGLDKPDEGKVECNLPDSDIVYCAQKPYMFSMSVHRNVEYGLRARGVANASERTTEILKQLNIAHLANQPARKLSGGEMHKVALARVLVLKPKLLLLDEPLAGLDLASREQIGNCICQHHTEGNMIIIATHLMQHIHHITSDITLMEEGRIMTSDTTDRIEGSVKHTNGHTM